MVRRVSITVVIAAILIAWTSAWAQTPEELKAVEKTIHAALNAHDVDQIMPYFADDAVFEYVVFGTTPFNGKEGVRGFFSALFQAWPDFQVTQTRELAAGNIVVTECATTGTHSGEWMGIPATGKYVPDHHMDVWEFEGTKVKRCTVYDDAVNFLVQFGLIPASTLPPLTPSVTLPAPEPTGLSPLEAEREAQRRWGTHDMALYARIIRSDAEFFIAPLGATLTRDGYIATQEMFFLGFPDLHMEQQRIIDMGDGWVFSEAVFPGTQNGPYLGVPATGKPMVNRVAWVSHYDENGLMTNANFYFDNLGVLAQLGAVQLPGASAVLPSSWGQVKAAFQE